MGRPTTGVSALRVLSDAVRGALMGLAELVPGISGGTIALIMGVYERLIASADHVFTAVRLLITGPNRVSAARAELARAHWAMLIPLVAGMALAVGFMAGVMKSFVSGSPILARGLFFGMVAACVAVPLMLIDRKDVRTGLQRLKSAALMAAAAIAAFMLTGLGGTESIENPSPLIIMASAAVAVCALVLPGVSGSFVLLVLGLYEATIGAVSELNLGYLAFFAAGALVGLGLFVKALNWLLTHRHTPTMLIMGGLLLGSLRALWPWQGQERQLLSPGEQWLPALALGLVGAALVVSLVVADRALARRSAEPDAHE